MTNSGGTAVAWTATSTSSQFSINPAGSTLAPGAQAAVTVSPVAIAPYYGGYATLDLGQITVTSSAAGDAPQTVVVTEYATGFFGAPESGKDFGTVFVGAPAAIQVGASSNGGGFLSSSNPAFILSGFAPHVEGTWDLTFAPKHAGAQSTTLTLFSPINCFFPPSTSTATGVGVFDATCTHVGSAMPCAAVGECTTTGTCNFLAHLYPTAISQPVSTPFNDYVAEGDVSLAFMVDSVVSLSSFTASIAWGDGGVSAGVLTGDRTYFTINGNHTYTTPGTFTGAITLTDTVSGLTKSTPLMAFISG